MAQDPRLRGQATLQFAKNAASTASVFIPFGLRSLIPEMGKPSLTSEASYCGSSGTREFGWHRRSICLDREETTAGRSRTFSMNR